MSRFVRSALFFVILNIVGTSDALVELPQVADNDILKTEFTIRSTINKLFTSIKLKGVRENTKLKQYRLIHNYFVSLTLKDYKNLKEIAGLTRTDKKTIDNSSINFIDLLNEILNEDSLDFETKSNTSLSNAFEYEILNYIDNNLHNIAYLKEKNDDNIPHVDINKEIISILENDERFLNKTAFRDRDYSNDDDLLSDIEFWVPESPRRIYKGKRTRIKEYPFMASIEIFNHFQCAGSIIKNDLVITAASCLQLAWNNRFYRENPAFLSVRIGSDYYEMGGENIPVLEVYFYPSYNPKTLRHNIAIMRLVRHIKFRRRKKRVKKITYDRKKGPLHHWNTSGVTVVGWGAQTQTNIIHNPWENKLSSSVLHIYHLQECRDIYSREYISERNFCAGFISKGGGACNKDVGGPGIVRGTLTGIISFGSPVCGTPDAPTVFTKVGFYRDWIEKIEDQEDRIPVLKKRTTTSRPRHMYGEDFIQHYNTDLHAKTTGIVNYPVTRKGDDAAFKVFLKTMFNSKEIDDYLNSGKQLPRVPENIAQIVRQQQISQLGPNVHDMPGYNYVQITPIQHEDSTEQPFVPEYTPPVSFGKNEFKAFKVATEQNDMQVFDDNNENYDDAIVSSDDNLENDLHSGSLEDTESNRKDIENNIQKLISNVDLKGKISDVIKENKTITQRKKQFHTTKLPLSENGGASVKLSSNNPNNIKKVENMYHNESSDDSEIQFSDAVVSDSSNEETGNKKDQLEFRNDKSHEAEDNTMAISVDSFKNNFGNKSSAGNRSYFGDTFSKKIIYHILAELLDYQNRNKTAKT